MNRDSDLLHLEWIKRYLLNMYQSYFSGKPIVRSPNPELLPLLNNNKHLFIANDLESYSNPLLYGLSLSLMDPRFNLKNISFTSIRSYLLDFLNVVDFSPEILDNRKNNMLYECGKVATCIMSYYLQTLVMPSAISPDFYGIELHTYEAAFMYWVRTTVSQDVPSYKADFMFDIGTGQVVSVIVSKIRPDLIHLNRITFKQELTDFEISNNWSELSPALSVLCVPKPYKAELSDYLCMLCFFGTFYSVVYDQLPSKMFKSNDIPSVDKTLYRLQKVDLLLEQISQLAFPTKYPRNSHTIHQNVLQNNLPQPNQFAQTNHPPSQDIQKSNVNKNIHNKNKLPEPKSKDGKQPYRQQNAIEDDEKFERQLALLKQQASLQSNKNKNKVSSHKPKVVEKEVSSGSGDSSIEENIFKVKLDVPNVEYNNNDSKRKVKNDYNTLPFSEEKKIFNNIKQALNRKINKGRTSVETSDSEDACKSTKECNMFSRQKLALRIKSEKNKMYYSKKDPQMRINKSEEEYSDASVGNSKKLKSKQSKKLESNEYSGEDEQVIVSKNPGPSYVEIYKKRNTLKEKINKKVTHIKTNKTNSKTNPNHDYLDFSSDDFKYIRSRSKDNNNKSYDFDGDSTDNVDIIKSKPKNKSFSGYETRFSDSEDYQCVKSKSKRDKYIDSITNNDSDDFPTNKKRSDDSGTFEQLPGNPKLNSIPLPKPMSQNRYKQPYNQGKINDDIEDMPQKQDESPIKPSLSTSANSTSDELASECSEASNKGNHSELISQNEQDAPRGNLGDSTTNDDELADSLGLPLPTCYDEFFKKIDSNSQNTRHSESLNGNNINAVNQSNPSIRSSNNNEFPQQSVGSCYHEIMSEASNSSSKPLSLISNNHDDNDVVSDDKQETNKCTNEGSDVIEKSTEVDYMQHESSSIKINSARGSAESLQDFIQNEIKVMKDVMKSEDDVPQGNKIYSESYYYYEEDNDDEKLSKNSPSGNSTKANIDNTFDNNDNAIKEPHKKYKLPIPPRMSKVITLTNNNYDENLLPDEGHTDLAEQNTSLDPQYDGVDQKEDSNSITKTKDVSCTEELLTSSAYDDYSLLKHNPVKLQEEYIDVAVSNSSLGKSAIKTMNSAFNNTVKLDKDETMLNSKDISQSNAKLTDTSEFHNTRDSLDLKDGNMKSNDYIFSSKVNKDTLKREEVNDSNLNSNNASVNKTNTTMKSSLSSSKRVTFTDEDIRSTSSQRTSVNRMSKSSSDNDDNLKPLNPLRSEIPTVKRELPQIGNILESIDNIINPENLFSTYESSAAPSSRNSRKTNAKSVNRISSGNSANVLAPISSESHRNSIVRSGLSSSISSFIKKKQSQDEKEASSVKNLSDLQGKSLIKSIKSVDDTLKNEEEKNLDNSESHQIRFYDAANSFEASDNAESGLKIHISEEIINLEVSNDGDKEVQSQMQGTNHLEITSDKVNNNSVVIGDNQSSLLNENKVISSIMVPESGNITSNALDSEGSAMISPDMRSRKYDTSQFLYIKSPMRNGINLKSIKNSDPKKDDVNEENEPNINNNGIIIEEDLFSVDETESSTSSNALKTLRTNVKDNLDANKNERISSFQKNDPSFNMQSTNDDSIYNITLKTEGIQNKDTLRTLVLEKRNSNEDYTLKTQKIDSSYIKDNETLNNNGTIKIDDNIRDIGNQSILETLPKSDTITLRTMVINNDNKTSIKGNNNAINDGNYDQISNTIRENSLTLKTLPKSDTIMLKTMVINNDNKTVNQINNSEDVSKVDSVSNVSPESSLTLKTLPKSDTIPLNTMVINDDKKTFDQINNNKKESNANTMSNIDPDVSLTLKTLPKSDTITLKTMEIDNNKKSINQANSSNDDNNVDSTSCIIPEHSVTIKGLSDTFDLKTHSFGGNKDSFTVKASKIMENIESSMGDNYTLKTIKNMNKQGINEIRDSIIVDSLTQTTGINGDNIEKSTFNNELATDLSVSEIRPNISDKLDLSTNNIHSLEKGLENIDIPKHFIDTNDYSISHNSFSDRKLDQINERVDFSTEPLKTLKTNTSEIADVVKKKIISNINSGDNDLRVSFHPDFLPRTSQKLSTSENYQSEPLSLNENENSLSIPVEVRLKKYDDNHSKLSVTSEDENTIKSTKFAELPLAEEDALNKILPQATLLTQSEIASAVSAHLKLERIHPSVQRVVSNINKYIGNNSRQDLFSSTHKLDLESIRTINENSNKDETSEKDKVSSNKEGHDSDSSYSDYF